MCQDRLGSSDQFGDCLIHLLHDEDRLLPTLGIPTQDLASGVLPPLVIDHSHQHYSREPIEGTLGINEVSSIFGLERHTRNILLQKCAHLPPLGSWIVRRGTADLITVVGLLIDADRLTCLVVCRHPVSNRDEPRSLRVIDKVAKTAAGGISIGDSSMLGLKHGFRLCFVAVHNVQCQRRLASTIKQTTC